LILPELCLLVHPPVVSLLNVPEDGVLVKEITHELQLFDIKTKQCLFFLAVVGCEEVEATDTATDATDDV